MPGGWAEEELVMISALEHYSYCPRQCALIHVEHVYDENLYTLRGTRAHTRAHDENESGSEEGVRIERGMPLFSERLGLIGKSDIVEFGPDETPFPIEYKVGPRKENHHDDLQLCAQALCLEEMFGGGVPAGAVFHHSSRRRREVVFTEGLRRETEEAVGRVREMILASEVPPPVADARCPKCSLFDACMPFTLAQMDVKAGLARLFDPER
ncbi:CRISPR-associated protein Cas4 [Rubrobacter indicoceani]|uniref:CRISPR-associated protein Cas4 n=1 Tax=Rubrobacter indicoceani TaxID=2051957 RepID=UPI000E5BB057|nr:CRISPR-associated protein Cas4 [Rubrobacter indicoceani]